MSNKLKSNKTTSSVTAEVKPIIVLSEDGMFTNIPIPLEKMVNLFCAATTNAVNQCLTAMKQDESVTDKDYEVAYRTLFDGLNQAYSKQLEICFPDMELHPEMTDEICKKILHEQDKALGLVEQTEVLTMRKLKEQKEVVQLSSLQDYSK